MCEPPNRLWFPSRSGYPFPGIAVFDHRSGIAAARRIDSTYDRRMDLHLAGKIAVVTGASKGIGLAVTHALVAEGARGRRGARSTDSLGRLAGVTAVAVDLASPEAPARLSTSARSTTDASTSSSTTSARCGCASRASSAPATRSSSGHGPELLRRAARDARGAGPMLERGGGAIVNVASVNAFFQPEPARRLRGGEGGAASTSARRWRRSSGPSGVRINCVSPGAGRAPSSGSATRRRRDRRAGQRRRRGHRPRQGRREDRRLRDRAVHDSRGGRTLVVLLASERPATSRARTTSSTAA